jgi:hypothetical protein
LIEAHRVRPDRVVVPTAKYCLEARVDTPAQPRRGFLGVAVVIDVGVIALDLWSFSGHSDQSNSSDAGVNRAAF